jgi:hypothetical protein
MCGVGYHGQRTYGPGMTHESTGWEGEVVGVVRTWVTCASGRVDRDGGGGSVVVLVTLELWHKVHDG